MQAQEEARQARIEAQTLKQAIYIALVNLTAHLRRTGALEEQDLKTIATEFGETAKLVEEPGRSLLEDLARLVEKALGKNSSPAEKVRRGLEVIQGGKNDDD